MRSPHLTKTVTRSVCGHMVSQGPGESQPVKLDQEVVVYKVKGVQCVHNQGMYEEGQITKSLY